MSRAAAVIAVTDLAISSAPQNGADRYAVRPTADRLNRSLEPDVLGDQHVARTIRPKGAAATGPVHPLPASWGVPKSGIGMNGGRLHGRSWTDPA